MIRAAAFTALILALAAPADAADGLRVKMLGVSSDGGSTLVHYALTSGEPFPIDFVRVACDLRGQGGVIDEAVDIQEDLGARATTEGDVAFNRDEVLRGRRFTCRVAAAFRNK